MAANTLVSLSRVPGDLDYAAYLQYLTQNGHLQHPRNVQGVTIPAMPVPSTSLQHNRGDRTDRLMDYRPDQALWSQDNLPEILYIFDKPANWVGWRELKEPPTKAYPIYGKCLRDIPVLPDHVSPDVEGWRLEAWSRFDPRIRAYDLSDRMPPFARSKHGTELSMRAQRFRRDANLLGWVAKGGRHGEDKQRITSLIQAAGVPLHLNWTRGVTWGTNPYGQDISVPEKLRWDNCVEAAPAPAPIAASVPAIVPPVPVLAGYTPAVAGYVPAWTTAGPTIVGYVPTVATSGPAVAAVVPAVATSGPAIAAVVPAVATSGPAVAPVVTAVVTTPSYQTTSSYPVPLPASSFTAVTNTNQPNQESNIPVTGTRSAWGTLLPAQSTFPSSSYSPSYSPFPSAAPINSTAQPLPTTNRLSMNPIPRHLDPRMFGPPPPNPSRNQTTGSMNPLPPGQAAPAAGSGTGIAASTNARSTRRPPTNPTWSRDRRALTMPDALAAIGASHDLDARARSANNTTLRKKGTKRTHHGEDEEGEDDEAATAEPPKKFRKRFPRAAFGARGPNTPNDMAEWLQQGGSSELVDRANLMHNGRTQPARPAQPLRLAHPTQPARPSLGYIDEPGYRCDSDEGDLTPDDFLHPLGPDQSRYERHAREQRFQAAVADRDFSQIDTLPGAAPVMYSMQSMGAYLPPPNRGQSNQLSQDVADSVYPPLPENTDFDSLGWF